MKVYQRILFEVRDRVAYITLNQPETHNALHDIQIVELNDALLQAEQDPMVKVMVIKANGPHFCVGMDPEYARKILQYTMDQQVADLGAFGQVLFQIYRSTKVIIAQVQGDAIGPGCGLLSACDISFVAEGAKLGFDEVRQGLVATIPMVFLLRKVGETRTKELLLSGRMISARTAEAYQLVNQVLAVDQLEAEVAAFTSKLCMDNSAASMQLVKKMVADIPSFPLENAMKLATRMAAYSRMSDDGKRGLIHLNEGKEANW
ncbi:MAG: enoyl-CoA hydratase-related protein [Bacteroidota bacterium]